MPDRYAQALCDFGRAAAKAGLLSSTCGNASIRIDTDRIALSGAGAPLAALEPDHLAVLTLADARHVGGAKPSMESEIHRRIYEVRPQTGAVLHCQSRSATLLACLQDPPRNLDLIPEVPAYVRRHAYVDYAAPGSEALAQRVADAFMDPDVTVVQMRNHGQVIIGAHAAAVLRRGVFFELGCWLASQGHELRTIPDEEASALRDYARDV